MVTRTEIIKENIDTQIEFNQIAFGNYHITFGSYQITFESYQITFGSFGIKNGTLI
jgi:hypothetical protein